MTIVDGEPYCPNYRCRDCGRHLGCKRHESLWKHQVQRTHPFFTRFTSTFPCCDFFPSELHVFDLKNYWTDFETWYADWLEEWQNGMSKEAFENRKIGFYLNNDESVWYYTRLRDWIYGTLFDGDILRAFEKEYYKRTRDFWGYKLIREPVNGIQTTIRATQGGTE